MSDRINWLRNLVPFVLHRIVPIVAILSMLSGVIPIPARAVSTTDEVEMGQENDKEIIQTNVVETDPLLNAYIQGIANKLWTQVARKDVPYNIKILKASDVNSFATLGGYVYIDEGIIDFVQSDDEMASIIGHETGHIERRHVLTMQSKLTALNFIFGIASMFSPIVYNLGNLAEAGIAAKLSRADEIQADRYGLQLMSRAGYDPDAMVTMMMHLNVLEDAHESIVDKYLEDHPGSKDRVKHLVGYPELDPTQVSPDEKLVRALGDAERARYNVATIKLEDYLKAHPGNTEALLKLGQTQLALGQTSKSEQTLAEVVQNGSPQARATAMQSIASLREINMHRVSLTRPNLPRLQAMIAQTQTVQDQASGQIQARRDEGRDQLKNVQNRIEAVSYEIPNLDNVTPKEGSRLEAMVKNLEAMSRAINSSLDDSGIVIDGVGTLEHGKESGVIKENSDLLQEMQAPLASSPIPSDSLAILPMYPSMLQQLQLSDGGLLASVDAARAALILTDQGLGDLDAFLKDFDHAQMNYQGDVSDTDTKDLLPLMQKASDSLNHAATAASQAAQLYNLARARQLSARIALLGVGTSPQRYATLQYDLAQRFGTNGIGYSDMLKQDLTPGDVTAATIIAADVKSTPEAIIEDAQENNRSMIDEANARGMHAWPLEIFMGLVYLDYTDDPSKEMHT